MAKLCTIILTLFCCHASAQHFEWVTSGGGNGQDVGRSIAVNDNDEVYVAGHFTETATFSGQIITGRGLTDIFLAKYDNAGELLWVRYAGGESRDLATAVGVDTEGNVYITGYITGEVVFGSSQTNDLNFISSNGLADIFIAKYNPEGILQWVRKEGGRHDDQAFGLAIDRYNNIYISGYFTGSTNSTCNGVVSNGSVDLFLAKYDAAGNCIWVEGAGSVGLDKSLGVAVDTFGNVIMTGFYYGVANFNNSVRIEADGLSSDGFIAKYNPLGVCMWAKSIGGPFSDAAYDIDTDYEGNIYVTGYFAEFAPFGNVILSALGWDDVFLAKYDPDGNVEWALSEGGPSLDLGSGLSVDPLGNIYLTGLFDSFALFGNQALQGTEFEIFVARYSGKGVLDWVKQAGGLRGDFGTAIAVSKSNARFAYFTGYYALTSRFDEIDLTPAKNTNFFVGKISPYTVGLEPGLSGSRDITVYPNPSNGSFFVDAGAFKLEDNSMLFVLDMKGTVVFQLQLDRKIISGHHIPVNLHVKSGMYFLKIESKAGTSMGKVIIFN